MNRRDAVKTTLSALGGLALTSSVANPVAAQENKSLRLRILSYNIQIGRGPGGSYSDPSQAHLDRTAAVVNAAKPDVVGLQEVDNKTNRSGSDVDQLGFKDRTPRRSLWGRRSLERETALDDLRLYQRLFAPTRP